MGRIKHLVCGAWEEDHDHPSLLLQDRQSIHPSIHPLTTAVRFQALIQNNGWRRVGQRQCKTSTLSQRKGRAHVCQLSILSNRTPVV